MYAYRKLDPAEQQEVLRDRKQRHLPWHTPPHFGEGEDLYLLTAACFDHSPIMESESRRDSFAQELISGLGGESWADVRAWVVLPNHYHVLARVDLPFYRRWIGRLHNSTSTRWNGEDKTRGRRVWYRFADRRVRGERHYYASINYVHANPVRHGWVRNAAAWRWSSLPAYMATYGRDVLAEWWKAYPVAGYGKGWDES